MLTNRTIVFHADGRVTLRGLETGKLSIHSGSRDEVREGDQIVLKEAGHKRWAAIGETTYEPAEFQVYKVTRASKIGRGWIVDADLLASFPAKAQS